MMGKAQRQRWSSSTSQQSKTSADLANNDDDEDLDGLRLSIVTDDDLITMNGDFETMRDAEARMASESGRRKRKSVTIVEPDEDLGENLLLENTDELVNNHNFRQDGSSHSKIRLENNINFVSNHQSVDYSNSSQYFRSLDSAEHVSTPLRKRNSCPSQSSDSNDGVDCSGDVIGSRATLVRRTSQSLSEAFMEQLPEVRSGGRDHMTSV